MLSVTNKNLLSWKKKNTVWEYAGLLLVQGAKEPERQCLVVSNDTRNKKHVYPA